MSESVRARVREAPFGYALALVPGAKEGQAKVSEALWSAEGAVPERLKELVFLRTSIVNRCET